MLFEDPARTLVAWADVAELHVSANQQLVQRPGRGAHPAYASAAIVREPSGLLRGLVVLTLAQSFEQVVYASDTLVGEAQLEPALEEAILFAESMGFILDATGWASLDGRGREQVASQLPLFRAAGAKPAVQLIERKPPTDPLAQVARLLAAFSFALLGLASASCGGMTAEQRQKSAEIHYDLGTNMVNQGDAQGALTEYLRAEKDDPDLPQIHNALGLVYGFSLGRPVEAEAEFKQALELRDDFSEADNNYGAFLLSRGRFAEAVPHFERAIANPLYAQRITAECNLGWAYYKTGSIDKAVAQLRQALAVTPKYCKGWRQLGTILAERGQLEGAHDALVHYAESCPDVADAQLQEAVLLARMSKAPEARAALDRCIALGKEKDTSTADECRKLLRGMGAP